LHCGYHDIHTKLVKNSQSQKYQTQAHILFAYTLHELNATKISQNSLDLNNCKEPSLNSSKEFVEPYDISNALKGGAEPTLVNRQFDPNNHLTTSVMWVFDFVNNCQFQFLKIL
jgi:hypothetical protein